MSVLDVRGLHVAFAGGPVVDGVDFAIAEGETLALVGRAGRASRSRRWR